MSYKLICVDMDGTVLNDEKKISEENKNAIKRAHEAGVKIAVCTGRLFTSAVIYADMLGIKAPVIASNGGYIREKDKDDVIYEMPLKKEDSKEIYKIVSKYHASMFFNTYDMVIANMEFEDNYTYTRLNKELPENRRIKLIYPENMLDFIEKNDSGILKCVCNFKDLDELNKLRKEIESLNKFEVASSGKDNFEVMPKGVCKGRAVKVLGEFYNIDRKDIICIGDNENDLSMLEYAGLGIAMGNAEDEIKKTVGYVTDTNNNSGVAKAINKFIFGEN